MINNQYSNIQFDDYCLCLREHDSLRFDCLILSIIILNDSLTTTTIIVMVLRGGYCLVILCIWYSFAFAFVSISYGFFYGKA